MRSPGDGAKAVDADVSKSQRERAHSRRGAAPAPPTKNRVSHRLEVEMRSASDGTALRRLTRRGRVENADKAVSQTATQSRRRSTHDID